jgi:hypothetical protein
MITLSETFVIRRTRGSRDAERRAARAMGVNHAIKQKDRVRWLFIVSMNAL